MSGAAWQWIDLALMHLLIPGGVTVAGVYVGAVLAVKSAVKSNRKVRHSEVIAETQVFISASREHLEKIMTARFCRETIADSIAELNTECTILKNVLAGRKSVLLPMTARELIRLLQVLEVDEPISLPRLKTAFELTDWMENQLGEERQRKQI